MQEEISEDLLPLGLSINGSTKKRRMKDEHIFDNNFLTLFDTREKMLLQHPNKRNILEDGKGLRLIHLLLISATSIDGNNKSSAVDSLIELYRNVSLNGDPIQRVTAYFADGLVARILTKTSPFYDSMITNPAPEEKFSAFTHLYRASPYYQFAHFTANQAIIEAFEAQDELKGETLHVLDFDVSYGFQWPSLIQSLSDKATATKPVSLRITGFGETLEDLKETEFRLKNFAKGCHNLFFEFDGVLRGSSPSNNKIKIKKDETLAVNLVFYPQSALRSTDEISSTLRNIYLLNPTLVVLVEKDGLSKTPRTFLSRFMESLHYFAAMFDSLDDCLPVESTERLSIEKNHLGREIKKVLLDDGISSKYERVESWNERMVSNRFEGVKLSSRSVSQAKLLLKIKSHCSGNSAGGFRVLERDEGRGLSLAWQDRHLVTVSSWRCVT